MDTNEILIHLGEDRKKYFNAISPPIIQSSNFAFDNIDDFRAAIANEKDTHIYTRGNNPTVSILRKKIAALEKAEDALITGSGSSAVAIAVMANLQSGDHAIVVKHPYSWTNKLFHSILSKYNITHTFVDGTSMDAIAKAILPNTKVLYLESPNSITFELQDLSACAELAKKHNLVSIIDNSYASPIFQNPISLGIDIVVHSGTKYINGHSDVVCGMVCGSTEMIQKIFSYEYMTYGTIISPNDAALVIRGIRTLKMRMHHIEKTTKKVVNFLSDHPKVEQILYPFHPKFEQIKLAKTQMTGCSGLFSILLNVEDKASINAFVNALKCFKIAVSWGGHESLIMPFLAFHDNPNYPDHHASWKLIRFSIGFEDSEYLIKDLEQAFGVLT